MLRALTARQGVSKAAVVRLLLGRVRRSHFFLYNHFKPIELGSLMYPCYYYT
jgi:hypothetical protein